MRLVVKGRLNKQFASELGTGKPSRFIVHG